MSTFENPEYQWRETYFVFFDAARRPKLDEVKKSLGKLSKRFEISEGEAEADGRFLSLTLRSPQDYAAMDICYETGEEVAEQIPELERELKLVCEAADREKLKRLPSCDAKFDVLHFEQVGPDADAEEGEMLDPSALLAVLNALVRETGGIGIDPQAGCVM